ncbi:MAG: DUF2853 family protein [Saprospiraceae bacterium]|nr:DUF2853 family protein [Saprospiraceae bacterium]
MQAETNFFTTKHFFSMSKFDEMMAKYAAELGSTGKSAVDADQLTKVAKGLGPSIYLKDASLVSCTDQTELDRVKANFLTKKLGMTDNAAMDAAIKTVCAEYNSKQRMRAVFYYMLLKNLGKSL